MNGSMELFINGVRHIQIFSDPLHLWVTKCRFYLGLHTEFTRGKLRQLNQDWAKFKKIVFVLDFNRIFNLNSWNPNQSSRQNRLNRLQIQFFLKSSNSIKRDQKEIQFDQKKFKKVDIDWLFWYKLTFSIFQLPFLIFQLTFWSLIDFFKL